MATVVNDRDVLIMGTTPRYTPPTDRGMFLTPSTAVFKLSADGLTASPSSFQFMATLLNMTGNVTWSTTGGISLVTNGNTATLNFASFTAVSGTITASITVDGQPFTQSATVTKLADGTIGHDGVRGTINISAATGGVIWSDSDANAAIAAAGYGTHQTRDVVTLYNQAGKFSKTKFWDGSAWQDVAQVLDGNLLVTGSVNAQSLAADAIRASVVQVSGNGDNLIPDPRFKDPAWWGFAGYSNVSVSDWLVSQPTTNTAWKLGCSLYLFGAPGGAYQEIFTKGIPVVKGATYLIEFQLSVSSNFNGQVSVEWLWPAVSWYGINQPVVGTWASDGGPVHYNASSAGTFRTVSAVVTLPDDSRLALSFLRIRHQIAAGNIELGSFIITRVNDSVLIKDGAITATKLSVAELSAITAYIGTLTNRVNGTGKGMVLTSNGFTIYDDNNIDRISLQVN